MKKPQIHSESNQTSCSAPKPSAIDRAASTQGKPRLMRKGNTKKGVSYYNMKELAKQFTVIPYLFRYLNDNDYSLVLKAPLSLYVKWDKELATASREIRRFRRRFPTKGPVAGAIILPEEEPASGSTSDDDEQTCS